MSKHQSHAELQRAAVPVPGHVLRNRAQRTFDLHPALHIATVAGYFAFLGFMGAAFMNRGLVIPFAICAIFIAMAFAVPGLWARVVPAQRGQYQSYEDFLREGIDCASGHLSGNAAVAQVLTLPALIVAWSAAILIIRMCV